MSQPDTCSVRRTSTDLPTVGTRRSTLLSSSTPTRGDRATAATTPRKSVPTSPKQGSQSSNIDGRDAKYTFKSNGGHSVLPSSFTRLNAGSHLNSTLSMPVIARQHVHASKSTPNAKHGPDSARLLTSSIEADRESTLNKRQTLTDDGSSTSSSSTSSQTELNCINNNNNSSSSSESVSSSAATIVSGDSTSYDKVTGGGGGGITPLSESSVLNTGSRAAPITDRQPPATPTDEQVLSKNSLAHPVAKETTTTTERHAVNGSSTEDTCTTTEQQQEQQQQQQQQVPTLEQRDALAARVYDACRTAGYEEWLTLLDLAPLASQHHLSGYNCIKFGVYGSPYAYVPLTLQQPAQTHDLMQRQRRHEYAALDWLARKRQTKKQRSSDSLSPSDTDGDGGKRAKCVACCKRDESGTTSMLCECGPLKNEAVLTSEWETPIANGAQNCSQEQQQQQQQQQQQSAQHATTSTPAGLAVKTSDTHPISISPIIPPELLHDISFHVRRGIPESMSQSVLSRAENHFDSETSDAGHHAFQIDGKRLIRCRVTQVDLCEVAFKAEQELIEASQKQRVPRSLTLQAPQAPEPPPQIVHDALVSSSYSSDAPLSLSSSTSSSASSAFTLDRSVYCETSYKEPTSPADSSPSPSSSPKDCEMLDGNGDGDGDGDVTMGNLLLSSCPGKKVRLTGPVRGRGAICRDLGIDLHRIAQMGVGAIVCCLDDEELQFLGAPWSEYEREADKLDVEIIRLPMAEGFSPTDVITTDKAISCIVNDYTLRGVHVLVHCRGGVGRAGLIACMWMLKLGLIRSDRDEMCHRVPIDSLANLHRETRNAEATNVHSNGDVMQTIHRVIETIRRRRSPKAIETAEQVCFLVKYLNYLHEQERKHLCRLATTLLSSTHD